MREFIKIQHKQTIFLANQLPHTPAIAIYKFITARYDDLLCVGMCLYIFTVLQRGKSLNSCYAKLIIMTNYDIC